MQNIKVGTPVYHYLNMAKIGTVVEITTDKTANVWMTEGSPTGRQLAAVQYRDGTVVTHDLSDLMRADLD
jgi:hypothetical protein